MTPISWIALSVAILQGILIPLAGIALKIWARKTKDEELRRSIDEAVRAVEELKASDQLACSKQDYVWKMIEEKYPNVAKHRVEIELLIHAAIQAASIGASGKSKDAGPAK